MIGLLDLYLIGTMAVGCKYKVYEIVAHRCCDKFTKIQPVDGKTLQYSVIRGSGNNDLPFQKPHHTVYTRH